MIRRIARYKIKETEKEAVLSAVKEFVETVERDEPGTVYSAYRHGDGVTFTHFMSFPGEREEEAHRNAPHTKKFVDILYSRCEEPPVFNSLELVKSSHIRFD